MLLSQAWPVYEADKRLAGYSLVTLDSYRLQTSLLIRGIGDLEIAEVNLGQLKVYLAAQTHLKPSSLGARIRFIRAFFNWAHQEGYIPANPAYKLQEPKLGQRLPKALSEEDTEMLREGCKSALEHALVEFIYTTGSRVREVFCLDKSQIDWDNRSCIVFGKGSKEREVMFSIKAGIWLKKYLLNRYDNDPALFVTERKPHRMSISEIRYIVKRVARKSDVQANVYPHKLRHSYATHLLNNGAPLEVIQSFLGHAKLETTRIYAQLSGPRRRELYKKYF
jgi:integrase/recombinase XerD